ncbi:hypothetical protein [Burkholderia sp. MSMB1589WGS]|uniref:hypothetical protein n=1 Tax=Burkholderia sp. MSMB1589WGS TaxID=1636425 RepID=UPI000ABD5344|nr:hypothetical protein [Burkholderia sp. MSMB1589WGS]
MVRNTRHAVAIGPSYVLSIPRPVTACFRRSSDATRAQRKGNDMRGFDSASFSARFVAMRNFPGFGVKNGSTRAYRTTT